MTKHAFLGCILMTTLMNQSNAGMPTEKECNESLKSLSEVATAVEVQDATDLATRTLFVSLIRYVVGRDSMVSDLMNSYGATEAGEVLSEVRANLDDEQRRYWNGYIDYQEALKRPLVNKFYKQDTALAKAASRVAVCASRTIFEDDGAAAIQAIKGFTRLSYRQATIGHFKVELNDCRISQSVGTGSIYTEPEQWPGSKFVVIDAAFKNSDSEGRLPNEGNLIIKQPDGTVLLYDNTETILKKGYGIYLQSVNPLVTMPTKIVYRIPDDVTGEILWQPGRNNDGKYLWCSFIYQGR